MQQRQQQQQTTLQSTHNQLWWCKETPVSLQQKCHRHVMKMIACRRGACTKNIYQNRPKDPCLALANSRGLSAQYYLTTASQHAWHTAVLSIVCITRTSNVNPGHCPYNRPLQEPAAAEAHDNGSVPAAPAPAQLSQPHTGPAKPSTRQPDRPHRLAQTITALSQHQARTGSIRSKTGDRARHAMLMPPQPP